MNSIVLEIKTLANIFETKWQEYKSIQNDLSIQNNNIWISNSDATGLHQRLGFLTEKRLNFVGNQLDFLSHAHTLVEGFAANSMSGQELLGDLDEKWRGHLERRKVLRGFDSSSAEGDTFDVEDDMDMRAANLEEEMVETAFGMSNGEMSSREAKERLTPAAYKAWKKAKKAAKRKKGGRQAQDYDYE